MEVINVLVVDDSLVIRGMLTNILEADKKIRVVGAVSSAADADNVISQQIVDVITLDIEMPGTNGLDYLPSLTRRRIPTIILSSQASGVREIALSRGAASCFDKANAVRDATILVNDVKLAALQKSKQQPAGASAHPAGPASIPNAAIEQLIAEHGDGLTRIIAERIGYATLDEDPAAVAKWVGIARKLREVQSHAGGTS